MNRLGARIMKRATTPPQGKAARDQARGERARERADRMREERHDGMPRLEQVHGLAQAFAAGDIDAGRCRNQRRAEIDQRHVDGTADDDAAITASTSGSGGASAILLGDLTFELGGRMAGVSQAPASPGGFSVNHCTMPGMSGSNGPGTEKLSTPARASPRFSKSWVTPPGTRTNDPLGA